MVRPTDDFFAKEQTMRTTQTTVRFSSPFLLKGFDRAQPAGDYLVDKAEELIEGVSWLAYRRVGTFIHLPAIGMSSPVQQVVQIDAADLEDCLSRDRR
ncbi:hypothetical protein BG36_11325 [Aquamicrobium defluvii]|uniref:Uncharacterized protein n=2 Tax=Aquamicrobium defluvii TaxID=69279 RepID=A0A011UD20_9HYPH|nr:hypothetical protein BG36_11325 [Aquamicrobium defluvii]EZQ13773.1 hypothetical protein CF98_23910 [Halopseudomonas bauzanensis]